ncbi:MAG: 1-acyl-sn-glycerol-3-phosphate acyltransferase [Vitreoscilla sp.]|nr:1-acyl-sn-glycerol-3-phosphate acyltransferase [Vitreoscilla sp.]MBP9539718.1 1-acyl-sn-glycerol-3-phosphate acyltransferase [Vitreoscilla sp.]
MKTELSSPLARVLDTFLCLITSFITGVTSRPASDLAFTPTNKVYYANHASHGDFVLVWISLPKTWRMLTQPVAGADYWLGSKLKAFIAEQVFRVLLIDRQSDPKQAIAAMDGALKEGKSLILFPEGTRNTTDDQVLLPFKSGLYHLARENENVEFVPVWINNINRVLPKGKILPIPLLCEVRIGEVIKKLPDEDKTAFLTRIRQALLDLAPQEAK